jgi:mRNA-degrading endonuclease toxin of MazEF toxin-antitoxin module
MQRGEIWMVDIQPRGSAPGHEQIGDRPAIIVQHQTANQSTVVIVPVTKQLEAQRFLGAVGVVQPSPGNGLSLPSIVLTNQVQVCDVRRFRRKCGRLEAAHLSRLETELKALLNL